MSRVLESKPTERGFLSVTFHDHYGAECSVQESSLASDDCIWLGTNDANPQVLASKAALVGVTTDETCGWVPFPVPDEVLLTTRMHLTRAHVKALLPLLEHFVKTGKLPDPSEPDGSTGGGA